MEPWHFEHICICSWWTRLSFGPTSSTIISAILNFVKNTKMLLDLGIFLETWNIKDILFCIIPGMHLVPYPSVTFPAGLLQLTSCWPPCFWNQTIPAPPECCSSPNLQLPKAFSYHPPSHFPLLVTYCGSCQIQGRALYHFPHHSSSGNGHPRLTRAHTHTDMLTHTWFVVHHCKKLCFALFSTINFIILSKVVCIDITPILNEVSPCWFK